MDSNMPELDRKALTDEERLIIKAMCDTVLATWGHDALDATRRYGRFVTLEDHRILSLLASLEEAEGRIEAAREAFLNFVADAKKFEQDIDGEYEDGRSVVTIRYDITTEHHGLWELIGALGFKHRRDETPFDAVCREIDEEPVAALSEEEA